jgi:hypothetical protein
MEPERAQIEVDRSCRIVDAAPAVGFDLGVLGVGPVTHIVVDERFNAAFSQVGWRRQSVV